MLDESTLDWQPTDPRWGHGVTQDADELRLHYVRQGQGRPTVLLLHGWPGFWYDWRRVLPLVAPHATVIAPDLRGFGESAKPDWPPPQAYGVDAQARNVLALLDHLQLDQVVLVGYDIGAGVAQTLARRAPERVAALVLSAPNYPGIGTRANDPAVQRERWYQYFHLLPQAEQIIGHNRATVRAYLAHFYDHWLGNKAALRPQEFEAIVDTYAQADAVRSSLAWYRAGVVAGHLSAGSASPPVITQPTAVVWGEQDPILRAAWADRLGDYFADLRRVEVLPGIGHFVPFEAPLALVEALQLVH